VLGVGSSQIAVLTGTDMGTNITVEGAPNLDTMTARDYDAVSAIIFNYAVPLLAARIQRRRYGDEHESGDHPMKPWQKSFLRRETPLGYTCHGFWERHQVRHRSRGVVKDAKESHVRDGERPYFYRPYSQFGKLFA